MIVFNLHCEAAHPFEGWFRSHADFDEQRARHLVLCPICGSDLIERALSAPRLNLGVTEATPAAAAPTPAPASAPGRAALASALQQLRAQFSEAENVGERFAEEARRIHYREAPARSIRGEATGEQYQELQDEGIEVMPLPRHWVSDESLN